VAYVRTLAQLRTSVLQLGSYERSADITPAVLLQYINDALSATYDICIACDDDYYVKLGAAFATVVGQDTYTLAADFYHLRKVELALDSSRWSRLRPINLDGANTLVSTGSSRKRYRYRLSNAGLVLAPVPTTAADSVRVYYVPLGPQLAVDSDTVTFDRPQEQKLVLAHVMRDIYQRQDLSTDEQDRQIAELTAKLRSIADSHDDGEPFYLNPRGPRRVDDVDDDGFY
jgi:hypothetical protein